MDIDVTAVVKIVSELGVVGLLTVILFGGSKGWWVFGRTYEEIVRERNTWRDVALKGTTLVEKLAAK